MKFIIFFIRTIALVSAGSVIISCGSNEFVDAEDIHVINEPGSQSADTGWEMFYPAAGAHEGRDFTRQHQITTHPEGELGTLLFGANLSEAVYAPEVWSEQEGVLTATADEPIWTQQEFDSYILDLEFKTASGTNSGVIIHVSDTDQWVPNSVEIQIADDFHEKWASRDAKWRCGAFFGRQAAAQALVKPPGEWNRMTIICEGPFIDVILNGSLVNSMDMRQWTSPVNNPDGSAKPAWLNQPLQQHPSKGKIGLQGKHAGAPVYFRHLRIKSL